MRCLFFFTLRYNYLFQPYPTILFGRPQHPTTGIWPLLCRSLITQFRQEKTI